MRQLIWGVTQSTYNAYLKRKNLPAKDVKNITKEEAKNIYYEGYWLTSGADKVSNPKMAIALFDTAVLHGPQQAKNFYSQSNGDLNKFLEIRKQSYDKIVAKDATQKVFYNGWNNRVNNLRKYTSNIKALAAPSNEEARTFYGHIETNNILEELKDLGISSNEIIIPENRVYTLDEIKNMPKEEFEANREKILNDFTGKKILTEQEAKEEVQSGNLIWVDDYTREDGTKVKGYYRSK